MSAALLQVEQLSKYFEAQLAARERPARSARHALREVSFDVQPGEILAILGEPGSGKSTLARVLMMLIRPAKGKVVFEGQDLARQSEGALRKVRRRFQMLFSDPRAALNPSSRVSEVMLEPLRVQRIGSPEEQQAEVRAALRQVGLNSLLLDRRLTALSAGERQRVALARLLTLQPALIICDDPARTLPPLAGEQLFKLMDGLRHKHGLAFIWLVNDAKMVAPFADRIGVLYDGRLVEIGATSTILGSPQHPYTRQWVSETLPTAPPDSSGKGCPFHPHCPHVMAVCHQQLPAMAPTSTGQSAACFLVGNAAP
jgi:ABC-type glutathione transport system ATPase component